MVVGDRLPCLMMTFRKVWSTVCTDHRTGSGRRRQLPLLVTHLLFVKYLCAHFLPGLLDIWMLLQKLQDHALNCNKPQILRHLPTVCGSVQYGLTYHYALQYCSAACTNKHYRTIRRQRQINKDILTKCKSSYNIPSVIRTRLTRTFAVPFVKLGKQNVSD